MPRCISLSSGLSCPGFPALSTTFSCLPSDHASRMSSHSPQRRRVKSPHPHDREHSAILRHIANNDGADMRRSRRWRCRRSLIADCMKARGWTILHITGMGQTKAHPCTSPAIIVGNQIVYTQSSGEKWQPSDPQPISTPASTSPSRKYG